MGQYWAANHGTALVLSYNEMSEMVKKYFVEQPYYTRFIPIVLTK